VRGCLPDTGEVKFQNASTLSGRFVRRSFNGKAEARSGDGGRRGGRQLQTGMRNSAILSPGSRVSDGVDLFENRS
jgi:hypothetical protein